MHASLMMLLQLTRERIIVFSFISSRREVSHLISDGKLTEVLLGSRLQDPDFREMRRVAAAVCGGQPA